MHPDGFLYKAKFLLKSCYCPFKSPLSYYIGFVMNLLRLSPICLFLFPHLFFISSEYVTYVTVLPTGGQVKSGKSRIPAAEMVVSGGDPRGTFLPPATSCQALHRAEF
jgi:hypothetical protein